MTRVLGQQGAQSLRDSVTRGQGGAPWARGGAALMRYPAINTARRLQFFTARAAEQPNFTAHVLCEAIGIICAGRATEHLRG